LQFLVFSVLLAPQKNEKRIRLQGPAALRLGAGITQLLKSALICWVRLFSGAVYLAAEGA
jgi:hypothetical protein